MAQLGKHVFTVADGITVQKDQLKQWKKVLKPKVYALLVIWVTKYNDYPEHKDGYTITRGSEMSNFVQNYALGHAPETISQNFIAYLM